MEAILAGLAEQQRELSDLVSGLDETDWQRLSRCEGWTVSDVVLHLAQTDALATAALQGCSFPSDILRPGSVDADIDKLVAAERDQPATAIHQRWRDGVIEMASVFAVTDPHARAEWVNGSFSAETMAATRLAEAWIHTGDVAEAFDVTLVPGERLRHVARLAWRTLPYAFAKAGRTLSGPVAFELAGPSGARWSFAPDEGADTVIEGDRVELCLVAARRVAPEDSGLTGRGPDAHSVLEVVRTYA